MTKRLNKDGSPRKKGSGRKKGAVSFTSLTLRELNSFLGQDSEIPVSRVWLEKNKMRDALKKCEELNKGTADDEYYPV